MTTNDGWMGDARHDHGLHFDLENRPIGLKAYRIEWFVLFT